MGIFDPDMIGEYWFDPCVSLVAWFDDSFVAQEATTHTRARLVGGCLARF